MQLIFYRSKRSETDNAPGTKKPRKINVFRGLNRAGDGNRTHVSSLEGWCSTIELHPHICACPSQRRLVYLMLEYLSTTFLKFFNFFFCF